MDVRFTGESFDEIIVLLDRIRVNCWVDSCRRRRRSRAIDILTRHLIYL